MHKQTKEHTGQGVAELQNVHVNLGGTPVLRGVSLSVSPGERVFIAGPNGSGKSTILRTIEGLDTPSSGNVRLFGHLLNGMKEAKRASLMKEHVGIGFQAINLDPSFSVLDNMIGLSYAFGRGGKETVRRAGQLASRLGLADKLRRPVSTLSGGEQLRVSLGRLFLPNPDLILLDEPTSMVDPRGKAEVYGLIDELAGPESTIVMVSHDLEAQSIATRRVEVVSGQIVQDQPTNLDPLQRAA